MNNNYYSKETQLRAKEIADRPKLTLRNGEKVLIASNPIMTETLKKMGYVEVSDNNANSKEQQQESAQKGRTKTEKTE